MSTTTTGISWTDRTWNPIRGCSRVSEGCRFCYAERIATRFSGPGQPYEGLVTVREGGRHGQNGTARTGIRGQWNGTIRVVEKAIDEPLSWRTPAKVFVNSMSDLFHENISDLDITRIVATMALARQHTFQILTKRPERMRAYFSHRGVQADIAVEVFKRFSVLAEAEQKARAAVAVWPLPNVWLGTSCENQATADERIPLLLQTPAAVRFISLEPLLSQINLHALQLMVDWVIVGGESGGHARGCEVSWLRAIVAQCQSAGVACFVKQLGSNHSINIRTRDRKGADPSEWPIDLRVQQFPVLVTK